MHQPSIPFKSFQNLTRPETNAIGIDKNVNALRPEDAPIHGWYRFVLSFPPHLVRHYAEKFGLQGADVLLDPFCGTGTTVVEAKKNDISSIGIEAVPMCVFAARTKLDWSCNPDWLLEHSEAVAREALDRLTHAGVSDTPPNDTFNLEDFSPLPHEQARLLFKDAISPLPLYKTMVLINVLSQLYSAEVANHEQLALASTLVHSISNLKFGPEVGIGKKKDDAEVVSAWRTRISNMALDLRDTNEHSASARIYHGDAREIDNILEPGTIDAVITSPPYPNEKDYTRIVRLESVLLGLMKDRSDLRKVKQNLVRSNTRGVFSADSDDQSLSGSSRVRDIAARIESRRVELGKTSGFERRYAQVALQYFGGMTRHLRALTSVLKPGARLAYVVGDQASYFRVMIRTGELLAEIASEEGYLVDGLELFRTRFATATGQRLNEEVLLLRWPG